MHVWLNRLDFFGKLSKFSSSLVTRHCNRGDGTFVQWVVQKHLTRR